MRTLTSGIKGSFFAGAWLLLASGLVWASGEPAFLFGTAGYVQQDVAGVDNITEDVNVSDIGRITQCGSMEDVTIGEDVFLTAQFEPTGNPFIGFGGGGYVTEDFLGYGAWARSVYCMPSMPRFAGVNFSNRVIVAGYAKDNVGNNWVAVAMYRPNGSLDTTFNSIGWGMYMVPAGLGSCYATTVKVDSQARIVIGGIFNDYPADPYHSRGFVMRLYWDGTEDTSFNFDGYATMMLGGESDGVYDLTIDSSNNVYALSYTSPSPQDYVCVTKFDANGLLIPAFGTGAHALIDFTDYLYPSAIELDSSSNIVVCGYTDVSAGFQYMVCRLEPAGSLDATFAGTGIVTGFFDTATSADSFGEDLKIDSSDRIVFGGRTRASGYQVYSVGRLLSDGSFDTTFGNGGITNYYFSYSGWDPAELTGIALDRMDNIIAAGHSDNGTDLDLQLIKLRR